MGAIAEISNEGSSVAELLSGEMISRRIASTALIAWSQASEASCSRPQALLHAADSSALAWSFGCTATVISFAGRREPGGAGAAGHAGVRRGRPLPQPDLAHHLLITSATPR